MTTQIPFKRRDAYLAAAIGKSEQQPARATGSVDKAVNEDIVAGIDLGRTRVLLERAIQKDSRLRGPDLVAYVREMLPPAPDLLDRLEALQDLIDLRPSDAVRALHQQARGEATQQLDHFIRSPECGKIIDRLRLCARLLNGREEPIPRIFVAFRRPMKQGKGGRTKTFRQEWETSVGVPASPASVDHSVAMLRQRMQQVLRLYDDVGEQALTVWIRKPTYTGAQGWAAFALHADGTEGSYFSVDDGLSWQTVPPEIGVNSVVHAMMLCPQHRDLASWLSFLVPEGESPLASLRDHFDRAIGAEGLGLSGPVTDAQWAKVAPVLMPPHQFRALLQMAYRHFSKQVGLESELALDMATQGLTKLREDMANQQAAAARAVERQKAAHRKEIGRLEEQIARLRQRNQQLESELAAAKSALRTSGGPTGAATAESAGSGSLGAALRQLFEA